MRVNMAALMMIVAMMVVTHGVPPHMKWPQDSTSGSVAAMNA